MCLQQMLGFFFRGPVAAVLALKPEWKIFKVLEFCKVVKVKLSFSVSLKQLWSFRVSNTHFLLLQLPWSGWKLRFSSGKREREH